jgi:hypothetical protein
MVILYCSWVPDTLESKRLVNGLQLTRQLRWLKRRCGQLTLFYILGRQSTRTTTSTSSFAPQQLTSLD